MPKEVRKNTASFRHGSGDGFLSLSLEIDFAVGAVAERLGRRVTTAAERRGLLGRWQRFAFGIKEFRFAIDEIGAVFQRLDFNVRHITSLGSTLLVYKSGARELT